MVDGIFEIDFKIESERAALCLFPVGQDLMQRVDIEVAPDRCGVPVI